MNPGPAPWRVFCIKGKPSIINQGTTYSGKPIWSIQIHAKNGYGVCHLKWIGDKDGKEYQQTLANAELICNSVNSCPLTAQF